MTEHLYTKPYDIVFHYKIFYDEIDVQVIKLQPTWMYMGVTYTSYNHGTHYIKSHNANLMFISRII